MKSVAAANYYDPNAHPTDFGISLGNAVIAALQGADPKDVLLVRFRGIRGAASSHANAFLYKVGQFLGSKALENRLAFEYESNPQRQIFERSRLAVIAAVKKEEQARIKSKP